MHTRLQEMAEEGKSYLSVAYNIGLVVFTATALGLLMGKITDLITHENQTTLTSDSKGGVDSK